jgi:hypothetical protein
MAHIGCGLSEFVMPVQNGNASGNLSTDRTPRMRGGRSSCDDLNFLSSQNIDCFCQGVCCLADLIDSV